MAAVVSEDPHIDGTPVGHDRNRDKLELTPNLRSIVT